MARRPPRPRSIARRPRVEPLEGRALMAVLVDQIPTPGANGHETSIVAGPGGDLWFLTDLGSIQAREPVAILTVASVDPTTGATRTFTAGDSRALTGEIPLATIALGPDGKLWFTEPDSGNVVSIDPTTGAMVATAIPKSPNSPDGPAGIVAGPDGELWFTEASAGEVGEINPTTLAINQYPLPKTTSEPEGIALGSDGRLWFVEVGTGAIAAIDPMTHAITEYPATGLTLGGLIAPGPDGGLWFSATAGSYPNTKPEIGEITTAGTISSFVAPRAVVGIAPSSDGEVAFTTAPISAYPQSLNGQVDEIDPTTHAITVGGLPDTPSGTQSYSVSAPGPIALGTDGRLYALDALGGIDRATVVPAGVSAITGHTFVDPAGDGTFGGNVYPNTAVPIGGLTVYLDIAGTSSYTPGDPTATTNASGLYTFSGLAPGSYTVRFVTEPGVSQSGPITPLVVAAGQVGVAGPIGFYQASPLLPLTARPSPFGTAPPDVSTAEVTGLYSAILGRAPDAPGLAFYVGALKNGGSLQAVASYLLHSAEYETIVVNQYYVNDFGRAATVAEADVWVSALQGGLSVESMAAIILTSPAYAASHASDASFIAGLYADVLGHAATPGEISAWQGVLATGVTHAQAVALFLASPPSQRLEVEGLYATFLGREYDQSGLAFYEQALTNGVSIVDVAAYFASSAEYVARANAAVG